MTTTVTHTQDTECPCGVDHDWDWQCPHSTTEREPCKGQTQATGICYIGDPCEAHDDPCDEVNCFCWPAF